MKKFNLKSFVIGVITAVIIMSSFNGISIAKSIKKNIEVIYDDIKIVVNNKPVKFNKDSQGNVANPFIYNGITYLPVRAVGEALDMDVKWDGTNKTVYLGEIDKGSRLFVDELRPHYNSGYYIYDSASKYKVNIAGKDYSTGLYDTYGHSTNELLINLNSQYKEIEFDYGPSGNYGASSPGKLLIYMDDELKYTFEVSAKDDIKKTKINVEGVNQLRLEKPGGGAHIGIGDPIIR